jgi:hypothetical protein
MRTTCTHIRRNPVCLFIPSRHFLSWRWDISVDMPTYGVRLCKFVSKFIIYNLIIPNLFVTKMYVAKFYNKQNLKVTGNRSPQRMLR